jgi:hypothetical protein
MKTRFGLLLLSIACTVAPLPLRAQISDWPGYGWSCGKQDQFHFQCPGWPVPAPAPALPDLPSQKQIATDVYRERLENLSRLSRGIDSLKGAGPRDEQLKILKKMKKQAKNACGGKFCDVGIAEGDDAALQAFRKLSRDDQLDQLKKEIVIARRLMDDPLVMNASIGKLVYKIKKEIELL